MILRTTSQLICICFLLLIASCKNDTTGTEKSIIEGLTEVPESEFVNYVAELDQIKFFNIEGIELSEEQVEIYFSNGSIPKLYTDEDGDLKLGILSPPTEEEKIIKEEVQKLLNPQ